MMLRHALWPMPSQSPVARMRTRTAGLSLLIGFCLATLYFFPELRLCLFEASSLGFVPLARIFGVTTILIVYNAALISGVGFALVSRLAIGWIVAVAALELALVVPYLAAETVLVYAAFFGVKALAGYVLFCNLRDWRTLAQADPHRAGLLVA